MTNSKKVPHVTAALNPAKPVHDLIAQTLSIINAMTGNSYFVSPNPPLATVSADNSALAAAETIALTKVTGAVEARDAKKRIVLDDLHHLKLYVQVIADQNPTHAVEIILSAGMHVKKSTAHSKQDFVATQGTSSGLAKLVVKAVPSKRASYEWQWSTDLKTWTTLPATLQARTTVPNLTPGTTCYFRSRAVTKTGTGDWSQVVSLIVK